MSSDPIEEYKKMPIDELAKKAYMYDTIISAVDSQTQYILNGLFKLVRAVQRNYTPIVGVLTRVDFEPVAFYIVREEDIIENYQTREGWHELKTTRISPKQLVYFEVIEQREYFKEGEEQ